MSSSLRGQSAPAYTVGSAPTLGLTGNHIGAGSVKKTEQPLERLRVAKKYGPDQDGAKRFARRYGDQLVCVRHRLSDDGSIRHTTVELVVESTPVVSRQRTIIALRIPPDSRATRSLLLACGAQWDKKNRLWLLPHMVAKSLRLLKYRAAVQG